MINEIRDGICEALHDEFGDEYRIYTEKSEQSFARPSFFVDIAESTMTRFLGSRFFMHCGAKVTFYPPREAKNAAMADMAARLPLVLEVIAADGKPLRGFNKGCEQGEVLTVSMSYDFYAFVGDDKEAVELMREYTLIMEG